MKHTSHAVRFYAVIGMLNVAVAGMFYVINIHIKPPVIAYAVPISHKVKPQVVAAIVGTPTRIVIPSLSIDLPVGIGSYDQESGSWTIDATKAYYADSSMPINDSNGNTLIYGHAQSPVFASLPNLQVGAKADIYTDTGYVFHYTYQSMKEVTPTDVSVFHADGPPTVTLQTCIGDWSAYRAMFTLTLDGDEKA